jgi:ubiquinone/menaquinone biosynthesis C-methylase UbiE
MIFNLFTLISILCCSLTFANDGNYSLAVGEEDRERLTIVNEICNPLSAAFLARCQIAEGESVLELGCGIGLISQKLASIVGENGFVLATDLSDEQLTIAKSLLPEQALPQLQFCQLSAYELSTLSEKFDVVYVRFLLCHLPRIEEVIRQVKSVLKPGGRFIIEDLTSNDTIYSNPMTKGMEIIHLTDRLQFEVQNSNEQLFATLPSLLEQEGFSIVKMSTSHPQLDTHRKRKILTYGLSSLKSALIEAGKLTLEEYESMYPHVEELANDLSIEVYCYEVGHICVTL